MSLLSGCLRFGLAVSCFLSAAVQLSAQIVINEIHFDPPVATEPVEFIELYNRGTNAVNLSGWQLSDAIAYTIPNGTILNSGGYLVIAQNPAALQAKFGVSSVGPWTGGLSNDGETIVLKNAAGGKEDEVEYSLGFPWPTVGDPPGYSIELINPAFDNNLGGNWRAAFNPASTQSSMTLIPTTSEWRYFKGTSEASSPVTAWRALNFNDSSWLSGAGAIGYGENFISTVLNDMPGNYTTVFFRKTFVVADPAMVTSLLLRAQYDDGFKVWINGTNILNVNISSGEVPYNGTAASSSREAYTYDTFNLPSPQSYLVSGTNILAIQGANVSKTSSDFFFDAELIAETSAVPHGPTPGAINSIFAANAPPQIRQVDHSPNQPSSGQPVAITAKISDPEGVGAVSLQYQIVTPGNYIELTDAAYTNAANWITVAMNDAGAGGDVLAGDSVYTAVIPASAQQHRNLIRYRITATDGIGASIRVPYADDPQPNFAYFCYNGIPAWQGAARPGVTPVQNFDTNVMGRLPTVQLLAKKTAVENATWFSRYGGDLYLWSGTLVYDGKVYDHIHYRARGGVWRYAMVKNMWKFDLNRGHDLQMRDDYGRKFEARWKKLNLGACIQQADFGGRGEQGMFESVGSRLFNLAGVDAFQTTFLQLRVVDETAESGPDQYEGDFWGLYLGVEQEDGRFLEQHELPDGNFYKMENGTGELNNLGPLGPDDKSDLNYILGNYSNATEDWWRTNWSFTNYFSYQAIVQAIHDYDINAGKNYFYFHNPDTSLWSIVPWDLDLTWAHNMYLSSWGGLNPLASYLLQATSVPGTGNQSGTYNIALSGARPAVEIEFKNRVREIRDLLFNTNQTWQLIDECAGLVRGPTNSPTFLDADRAMWDYNPKMASGTYSSSLSKAGQGLFYQWPNQPTVTKNFNGCIQLMKNYVIVRAEHLDDLANDPLIPTQPTVTYLGPTNFPVNNLTFRSSNFSGSAAFAAMKWRVGEVLDTNAPSYHATEPQPYEIAAKWESAEISNFNSDINIPADALKAGHAYRMRVRMKDVTGRWSNWSAPVQFISGQPQNAAALISYLRVSELMYQPTAGSDYEFIELHNTSTNLSLDLAGAAFTSGVTYTFPIGATLAPNAYLLVIRNASVATFRSFYGLSTNVPCFGPYTGSLANEGEQLTLETAAGGTAISDFDFSSSRNWPIAAAGAGHSLVPVNVAAPGQATGALDYPGNWRASAFRGGSPGQADPTSPAPTILLNEIVAHTDYYDPLRPEYDSDDWIELFNTTATNINLSGWYLSDDPANPAKWAIPSVSVPARGWLTFSEVNDFHNPITSGFGLDKAGEQVLLSYLPGTTVDRVVDAVGFKGQENERSLSRYTDGAAFWNLTARTRNTANSSPLANVRITEIMYHPPDFGTTDNARDEYIQLYNPTGSAIALQDTNGIWRLDGGVSFTFPTNTVIPAGGTLLVVSFAPTDIASSNLFREVYGVTNASLPLAGPYSGKLSNRSDRVALERPQFPDFVGDTYSWVIVDEVVYCNQAPWPPSANGIGDSLHRRLVTKHGDDPENWYADVPTPQIASTDRDGDGLPNDWEVDHGFNPDDAADALLDADCDGLNNYQEFLCGSDPRDAGSVFRFESIDCLANTVQLHFSAVSDRSYSVQFRTSLGNAVWQNLTNLSAAPITRSIVISDALSGSQSRYYRLVTPAAP